MTRLTKRGTRIKSVGLISGIIAFLFFAGPIFPQQSKTKPKSKAINIDEELRKDIPQDRAEAYYHFTLAKLYERSEELEKAVAEFRKAIDLDQNSSQLHSEFAESLLRAGSIMEAMTECRKAIALDPDNIDAHMLLGHFYLSLKESPKKEMIEDAIKEFEEVIRIDSTEYRAYITLGQLYLNLQKYEKAIKYLEKFVELQPDRPEGYQQLALAYNAIGKPDEALRHAKKALEVNPQAPQTLELLLQLYAKANDYNSMIEIFHKILESDKENTAVRRQLAVALIAGKKYEEAIKELRTVLEADPHDALAHVHVGRAYIGLKKADKAIEAFQQALALDESNVEVKYYLAVAREENGETDKAIEQLDALVKQTTKASGEYTPQERDDRALFMRQMGFIYLRSGEPKKAIEVLSSLKDFTENPRDYELLITAYRSNKEGAKALELSDQATAKFPDDRSLKLQKAQLLGLEGQLGKGVDMIQRMIENNPKDIEAYMVLSEVYTQAKEFAKAEATLKKAFEVDSANENLKFRLGAVYERSKNYAKAEELFTELINANPKNAEALNYLGYMLADRGVKLDQALDYIKRAVEIEPNNGAYLDSLGWAYFKLNNLKLAEEFLTKAVGRIKNDPTVHDHLGDLYFKIGEYSKAEEAWRKAISNGTEEEEIAKIKEKIKALKKLLANKN